MDDATPATRYVRSFTGSGGTVQSVGSARATCELGDAWVFGRPFRIGGPETAEEKFLTGLDGKFSLVCRRGEEWLVATDLLGCGPVYYRTEPGRVSFSTHLGELLRSESVELDELAALAVATTSICLGGRTPYQGVSRLGGGEYLVLDSGHTRVLRRGTYATLGTLYDLERTEPGDPGALAELLRAAVAREPDVEGLFLSGGLDSQAVALALPPARRRTTLALSYGEWRSPDRLRGGHVARHLGIPHQVIGQRSLDPFAFWDPIVTLGGGQTGLQTSQHVAGARAARRHTSAALTGFLGDYVSGSKYDKFPDVRRMLLSFSHLNPATRAALNRTHPELVAGVDELFLAEFDRWPGLSLPRQQLMTSLMTRQPNHISGAFTLMHRYVDISTPLYHRDLMGYLLTRDDRSLKGQALYRSSLMQMGFVDPNLAKPGWGSPARFAEARGGAYMTANWASIRRRQGTRLAAAVDQIDNAALRSLAQIPNQRPMSVPLSMYALPIAAVVQPELRSALDAGQGRPA